MLLLQSSPSTRKRRPGTGISPWPAVPSPLPYWLLVSVVEANRNTLKTAFPMLKTYMLSPRCTFNKVIVSFKSVLLLLPNHQYFHFSAIRLNTGIFLDWPIREILSLYFLSNRTKVSLSRYSARYQYPYFQVQIEMANTGNRLFTFRYIV
jgi:hypothetical protein